MHPRRDRFATAAAISVLFAFGATARQSPAPSAGPPPRGQVRLAKHDRARLAWLLSEGRSTASVLIAYPPRRGDTLVQRLIALGGRVRYQADTMMVPPR